MSSGRGWRDGIRASSHPAGAVDNGPGAATGSGDGTIGGRWKGRSGFSSSSSANSRLGAITETTGSLDWPPPWIIAISCIACGSDAR